MITALFNGRRARPVAAEPRSLLATVRAMVESGELDPADSEERFQELLRRASRR